LFLFDENGEHRKVAMKNIQSFQLTKENVICVFIPKESDLFILSKKRREEILNILKDNNIKILDYPKKLNFKKTKFAFEFSDIELIRKELRKIVENGIYDYDFTEKLIEASLLIRIENELDFQECLNKFVKKKNEIQIKENFDKKLKKKKYQGILKMKERDQYMTDENKIQLEKLKEFEDQKNYLLNLDSFDNVEVSNELKDYLHLELKRAKKYSEFQYLDKLKKILKINEIQELKSKIEVTKNPLDHYIKIEHKGFPENRIDTNKFLIHISTFDRLGNGNILFIQRLQYSKRRNKLNKIGD
jgi:hypothetical protein